MGSLSHMGHLGVRKYRSTTYPSSRNTRRKATSTHVLAHSGRCGPCASRIADTGMCDESAQIGNLLVFEHLKITITYNRIMSI